MQETKTEQLPDTPKRLQELYILRAVAILLIVFYHLPFQLGVYPANVIVQTQLSLFVTSVFGFAGAFGMILFFFV